jgi:hypothetical protein
LISNRFVTCPDFLWITLLIDPGATAPKPEESRLWLECTQKRHGNNANEINDLGALWDL